MTVIKGDMNHPNHFLEFLPFVSLLESVVPVVRTSLDEGYVCIMSTVNSSQPAVLAILSPSSSRVNASLYNSASSSKKTFPRLHVQVHHYSFCYTDPVNRTEP